jgi:dihydroxyacid dehydratase/phosphogluconate dehydratase
LHLPAIAFSAGLRRPTVADWIDVNRKVQRIVDVLPNGPRFFKTIQAFLAGGVPEVMLRLREIGALELNCMTVTGMTVGENLAWWERSARRSRFRAVLKQQDAVDPDDVIVSNERRLGATLIFPTGDLAPEGSVVKIAAMDESLWINSVYDHLSRARVFVTEDAAIAAVKSTGDDRIKLDEVIVLLCRGPLGAGMPETAQITIALKMTRALKNVPLITDGRFSGLTSGPCIGHVGPEALAGGPIGKIVDGDRIRIHLDRGRLEGRIELIEDGAAPISQRQPRADLKADPSLPPATRLWAVLQQSGGGTWGGCVYDVDRLLERLR